MRASYGYALLACLLSHTAFLVLCYQDQKGYDAEEPSYQDEAIDVVGNISALCPTARLLRIRDTCQVDGAEIQCIKLTCCENYVFIAGRCIPSSVDPCSLQLCEQACDVQDERVWCSCHPGFTFSQENFRHRSQPYCLDIDECSIDNGGCEQVCVNDPGGFHCECNTPFLITIDGKRCTPVNIPEPLPLIRASSRCYAPCDTVSWLSKKVKQLSDQLHTTQTALKKMMENSILRKEGTEQFAEGNPMFRVLDGTAPLEGGYCRCERGPRGPSGPPGMEGQKGDTGARGPRGARGPKGSLDLMLLLLADIKHDIKNLEDKVYKDGEHPERFNLQKAWRRQRKQEKNLLESKSHQDLEAYTAPSVISEDISSEGTVQINPTGQTGAIEREADSTTDFILVKGDPEPSELPDELSEDVADKLRQFQLLAQATLPDNDDEEDTEDDYSFY